MKRLFLVCVLFQQPVFALAEEVTEQDTFVSPLKTYQGWQEPTVRDWQETHHQVSVEASGHASHSGMTMPDMPQPKNKPSQPIMDMKNMPEHEGHEGMSHQGMSHQGMNMPTISPETMPSTNTGKEGQDK